MPTAKNLYPASNVPPADRRRRSSDEIADNQNQGLFTGIVTFRMGRIEPMVAWLLATYTMLVSILNTSIGSSAWLIALFAASMGGWSRTFPARRQAVLLLRGVLLLLGGLVLQVVPNTGGAAGDYFFWTFLVAIFYALLLAKPWASLLMGLATIGFGLSCWLTWPLTPWLQVITHVLLLILVPPLAMAFGSSLRQSDRRSDASLRDARTLLYNESGFFAHGATLLAECRKNQRPFSMVLLNGAALRDIPALLGRKVANDMFAQLVRGIGAVPGEGIAARVDTVEFALLLPGVTTERATALVQQQLGDPPRVEVKIDGKPVTVLLEMVAAQADTATRNLEALYDSLHVRLSKKIPAHTAMGIPPAPEAAYQQADLSTATSPTPKPP